jgi:hypothetical protein
VLKITILKYNRIDLRFDWPLQIWCLVLRKDQKWRFKSFAKLCRVDW